MCCSSRKNIKTHKGTQIFSAIWGFENVKVYWTFSRSSFWWFFLLHSNELFRDTRARVKLYFYFPTISPKIELSTPLWNVMKSFILCLLLRLLFSWNALTLDVVSALWTSKTERFKLNLFTKINKKNNKNMTDNKQRSLSSRARSSQKKITRLWWGRMVFGETKIPAFGEFVGICLCGFFGGRIFAVSICACLEAFGCLHVFRLSQMTAFLWREMRLVIVVVREFQSESFFCFVFMAPVLRLRKSFSRTLRDIGLIPKCLHSLAPPNNGLAIKFSFQSS